MLKGPASEANVAEYKVVFAQGVGRRDVCRGVAACHGRGRGS